MPMQISRNQQEAKLKELLDRGGPITDEDQAYYLGQDLFPQHRLPRIMELSAWFVGVQEDEITPVSGFERQLRWHELKKLTEQMLGHGGKLGLQ